MSISQPDLGSSNRFTAFWPWGWAMLLVVLLSAAPTGNQVHIRAVGSAFDPAAVAVAMNPKKLQLGSPKAQAVGDKRTDTSAGLALDRDLSVAHPLLVLPAAGIDRLVFAAGFRAAVPAHPLAYARAARAPPDG